MLKSVVLGLVVALAVASPSSCEKGPQQPLLKYKVGDGRWGVDSDIARGTWVTANTDKHSKNGPCEWVVTKRTSNGKKVDLRSEPETDNKIQQVFLGGGDVFETHHCGTWVRKSAKNLT